MNSQSQTETGGDIEADELLDVSGYNCPLPILKTKARLNTMDDGQVLHVIATDPLAPLDFRVYCERTANELLSLVETDGAVEFYIRKRS